MQYRKFQRKRYCKFCADKIPFIDYKEIKALRSFLTERGKIVAARMNGNCAKHQRELTQAIKRARSIALMPYVEK